MKVSKYHGFGKLVGANQIEVQSEDGKKELIEAKNIVIATGSEYLAIKGLDFDENTIVSSTGALSLPQVPKKMVVIGGGIIGVELVTGNECSYSTLMNSL